MRKLLFLCCSIFLIGLVGCHSEDQSFIDAIVENGYMKSNIGIVQVSYENNDNVQTTKYSSPSSCVIIKRNEHQYYALTAYHVVQNSSLDYSVLLYDEVKPSFPLSSFYVRKLSIVKQDSSLDLALVSFTSNSDLPIVAISNKELMAKMKVASISNCDDKGRNYISTGKIKSICLEDFSAEGLVTSGCFSHSCYISPGASGSAVLNENFELEGINLGTSKNILGKFVSAKAVHNS